MSTVEELEAEKKRVEIEKGIAETRAQIDQLRLPLWRRGGLVAVLTAIIAAVLPATTAVVEYFHKEQELGLQRTKQDHEIKLERERQTEQIRTGYLDRLKDSESRQRTLRFLIATAGKDDPIRQWAIDEKQTVDEDARRMKEEFAALQQKEAATRAQLRESKSLSAKEKAALQHQIDVEDVELADKQFDLKSSQIELSSTKTELATTTSKLNQEQECSALRVRSAKDFDSCIARCDFVTNILSVESKEFKVSASINLRFCKGQCFWEGVLAAPKCAKGDWKGPPKDFLKSIATK